MLLRPLEKYNVLYQPVLNHLRSENISTESNVGTTIMSEHQVKNQEIPARFQMHTLFIECNIVLCTTNEHVKISGFGYTEFELNSG